MRTKQTQIIPNSSNIETPKILDKVVSSFKSDFYLIREKGFIPSNRSHNTGIGKTFEDLVGIYENNNQLADYEQILELKSARELSNSMITLFTKSPSYPKRANTYLRESFGYSDLEFDSIKTLHTTISASTFNTCKGKYGFKLEVDDEAERIYISIKNLENSVLESTQIYYTYENLRLSFEKKCKYIAYINAETKNENGTESFRFKNAYLLTGLTFDSFINHIKDGLIVYDIRIGAYKSGSMRGKTHDHGSGFRIKKQHIGTVFNIEEL